MRYAFRAELSEVHTPDRRDWESVRKLDEVEISDTWVIVVPAEADPLVMATAQDLQDYLLVSMGVGVRILKGSEPSPGVGRIGLAVVPLGGDAPDERRHRISVAPGRVELDGEGPKGVARACHHLEELLNFRGGPFLQETTILREPSFAVRMSHSGFGVDEFPDAHLAQLAHQGIDAIVVFASAPDHTPDGRTNRGAHGSGQGRHQRFSELADRADRHGLDLYLYAYFHGERAPHPDDPNAQEFYDRVYGDCFAVCPQAKGIVLVGESIEFPSKDPRTTGRLRTDPPPDGRVDRRPSPGWWPCEDYPLWVERVRDACRRHNPEADVVFWTYNWGWAPQEARLSLLRNLPDDVTVQVTFEMFEPIDHDGIRNVCVDYTASQIGPGRYFRSEAEVVHERGMGLSAMANSTGLTWDFGSVPYQPIPFQWAKRHEAVLAARRDWGLRSVMENHHYGLWPSIISELAQAMYHEPAPDPDEYLSRLAARDFGSGADDVLAAWRHWSEASTHYLPTNADQYGPFRIGPSYPLVLFSVPQLRTETDVLFGDLIVKIPYQPETTGTVPTTAPIHRVPAEIRSLERMQQQWREGMARMDRAVTKTPAHRWAAAHRMANLARYIDHCLSTTIHVKKWWQTRAELLVTADLAQADRLIAELEQIAGAEREQAVVAIQCVEADSRLGWEPSMGYVGDRAQIEWKIDHLDRVLGEELPAYRRSLGCSMVVT